jgi:hypothetical protein
LRGFLGDIVNIAWAGRLVHATFRPIRDMRGRVRDAARAKDAGAPGRTRSARIICTRSAMRVCAGREMEASRCHASRPRRGIGFQFPAARFPDCAGTFFSHRKPMLDTPARIGRRRLPAMVAGPVKRYVGIPENVGTISIMGSALAARRTLCAQDCSTNSFLFETARLQLNSFRQLLQKVLNGENERAPGVAAICAPNHIFTVIA